MNINNIFDFLRRDLKNTKFFNFDLKKNQKINNVVLTNSYGYELPFFHYSSLGIGNLILTLLYALFIKSHYKTIDIINYYPLKIDDFKINLKYWLLRSSFSFNYKAEHLKRLSFLFLLGKPFKDSFIKDETLFLTNDIINQDIFFFKKISNLNPIIIKNFISNIYKINYQIFEDLDFVDLNNKDKIISLGLHLRRGDFSQNKQSNKIYNSYPDIDSQIRIIKNLKSKISIINIYSDQSFDKTKSEINGRLDNFKLNYFPEISSGQKVLEHMLKNEIIILSNSTLSVVSCILSRQIALFQKQILPKKIKKFFKNIIEIEC